MLRPVAMAAVRSVHVVVEPVVFDDASKCRSKISVHVARGGATGNEVHV